MHAIVVRAFGPPDVMGLEEVPIPQPAPGELLVRVHAVTVNRTVDCAARAGTYTKPIHLPFIPGVDPCGVVTQLGEGVHSFRVGDRITAKLDAPVRNAGDPVTGAPTTLRGGGYAQYVCVPANRSVRVPERLDFAAAAVVSRHFPLALLLLRSHARLQPGEWVLVMGAAGGLGNAGLQVARHLGARVIAAAGSDARVQSCLNLGADAGINYRSDDLRAAVMRITQGNGVDVVYENIGDPELFPAAFTSLAYDGRLVTAGGHGGGIVPLDIHHLYQKHLRIIGTSGTTLEDMALSLQGAADGHFKPMIDRVLPLRETRTAHALVETRSVLGKVVLDPSLP